MASLTAAPLALHPDPAAVQLDELLGEGQAEAGAKAAQVGSVGNPLELTPYIEQPVIQVLPAVVGHGATENALEVELDGMVEQLPSDLRKAIGDGESRRHVELGSISKVRRLGPMMLIGHRMWHTPSVDDWRGGFPVGERSRPSVEGQWMSHRRQPGRRGRDGHPISRYFGCRSVRPPAPTRARLRGSGAASP